MAELERSLRTLAAELDWPATPEPVLVLAPRRRDVRRALLAAVALAVVAAAVALSVPSARSAILHALHLGSDTVVRVDTLPRAPSVPLGRYVGPAVGTAKARSALGGQLHLPPRLHAGALHLQDSIVSTLLHAPEPVLFSELRSDGYLLKKLTFSSTHVIGVVVDGNAGLWITGAKHVIVFPDAPPRLAGNVLVWQRGTITYRLEAPHLRLADARTIAAQIDGTS
jgi:hypothetical protein